METCLICTLFYLLEQKSLGMNQIQTHLIGSKDHMNGNLTSFSSVLLHHQLDSFILKRLSSFKKTSRWTCEQILQAGCKSWELVNPFDRFKGGELKRENPVETQFFVWKLCKEHQRSKNTIWNLREKSLFFSCLDPMKFYQRWSAVLIWVCLGLHQMKTSAQERQISNSMAVSRSICRHQKAGFTQNGLDSFTSTLYIAIDSWGRIKGGTAWDPAEVWSIPIKSTGRGICP